MPPISLGVLPSVLFIPVLFILVLFIPYQRKIIPSIPVTAFYNLEDGIHELTGRWISSEERNEAMDAWLSTQVSHLLSFVA
jgi:hypothetical protein